MPGRHLGQNFLYNTSILAGIIEAAGITREDVVVEIGPGPGRLTRMLAEKAKKLVAIELDDNLFQKLKICFAGYNNVELIHADALKFPFESIGDFRVVANIPYYITTPIIFRLLEAGKSLKTMTLTVQKEVAERIVAAPGGKDYGVLSIMVQYHTRPELKFIIPKEAFRPVPRVDSAVLHIEVLESPSICVRDEKLFARLVRTAFSQRRKTLANSLKSFSGIRERLVSAGIDPRRRPETLSLAEFAEIANSF
ncbi:MAG: 16S rRNA (adenine(1518)-N(6)/adenine(1519)-N(6))-dimethyltransferase RsmA [Nitrospirota bacterium]|nr:16S rRNA (adenine(1518)-N(6)/adenine(1519)-N(6))-dimethyltransferase RsmA [Nitrospirota bacterium]